MFEDKRRLFNLGGLESEQFTDPAAALNTYYMSLAGTTLAAVPIIGGASELTGDAILNSSKASGGGQVAGRAFKTVGKGFNIVTKGVLKVGAGIGKGIDLVLKGGGKLIGKNISTNMSGAMGKHYLWLHGLIAARMLYKWVTIDLPKKPKNSIANKGIGGKVLGYDNDPNSPTYLQSVAFQKQLQRRIIAEQNGLPGAALGSFAQRQFRYLTGAV